MKIHGMYYLQNITAYYCHFSFNLIFIILWFCVRNWSPPLNFSKYMREISSLKKTQYGCWILWLSTYYLLQHDRSNINMFCRLSGSYSLWACDDVAKVSALSSAGKLFYPDMNQLSFHFHVLQLFLPRWIILPLHPPLDLWVHRHVRPLCTTC